uniref:Uncharacterized protein n=1 Tax=Nelumbo nucifera TaxID=4432 RepID=A0A822Z478_NELNU|nr:TPA_asm: hypothetical protein HUJ06_008936 [Nelumbo nucifera]
MEFRRRFTQNILGEKGRRIRELISVFQKRFNFPENNVSSFSALSGFKSRSFCFFFFFFFGQRQGVERLLP